jgi:hypothetical protein
MESSLDAAGRAGDQPASRWRTAATNPFSFSIDTRSLAISCWNTGSLTISAKDGSVGHAHGDWPVVGQRAARVRLATAPVPHKEEKRARWPWSDIEHLDR